MTYQQNKLEKLVSLIEQHSPQEGVNFSRIENFGAFKASATQGRTPFFEISAIVIVGRGKKYCYVGDKRYEYSPGIVQVTFFPMPVDLEIVEASPEEPLLSVWVGIDLSRMADVLLRIDRIDGTVAKSVSSDLSGIFSTSLNDRLLDPTIRLLESLSDPRDAAMLGEMIMDEIYYRLLCHERGGELRFLLQQRGEIQRISKAVEYIHQNLDQPVSVDRLAEMAHMSRTIFFENFRQVMHMSPLQYAKSVKLYKAQILIKEGKKANEAGYLVGYNSPTQFSREYKRYFGFPPSAT
jgi:AraC-like DNA-binding protein